MHEEQKSNGKKTSGENANETPQQYHSYRGGVVFFHRICNLRVKITLKLYQHVEIKKVEERKLWGKIPDYAYIIPVVRFRVLQNLKHSQRCMSYRKQGCNYISVKF